MREIKFRAWDIEKQQYDYKPLIPDMIVMVNVLFIQKGWILEQFTGLKDKNGTEYYDGDITDFTVFDFNGIDTQLRGEIKWLSDAFVFGVEYIYAGETNVVDLCTLAEDDERLIIGNIHQGILTQYQSPDIIECYGIQNDNSSQKSNKQSTTGTSGKRGDKTKNRISKPEKNKA